MGTKKFKDFNKTNLLDMRVLLEAHLQKFAERHNVTVDVGNFRFDSSTFKTPLQITIKGHQSATDRVADAVFKNQLDFHDLKKKTEHGELFGYNRRSKKYPWKIILPSGKRVRAPHQWVYCHFHK